MALNQPFMQNPTAAPVGQRMGREVVTEEEIHAMQGWTVQQVTQWLQSISMGRFTGVFIEHEITGDLLALLSENDLMQMGIIVVGPRKHLLKELAKVKKAHRAYSRHKIIWRASEDLSRGSCLLSAFYSMCPLCVDQPASYRLTGVLLKITKVDRGICCGMCRAGSTHSHNNISLKEVVDVDSQEVRNCCGTERRITISAQEGITDGMTSEFEIFVNGKGDNTLTGIAQLIQSAVEDAKEAVLVGGEHPN
jgi:hypothetical protein